MDLVYKLASLGSNIVADHHCFANESLKNDLGVQVTIVCVDFAYWDTIQIALSKHCHNIDLLVNNPGYAFLKPLEELPREEIEKILDINVEAPILLTQMVAKGMKQRNRGAIVNISSLASLMTVDEHVPCSKYCYDGYSS